MKWIFWTRIDHWLEQVYYIWVVSVKLSIWYGSENYIICYRVFRFCGYIINLMIRDYKHNLILSKMSTKCKGDKKKIVLSWIFFFNFVVNIFYFLIVTCYFFVPILEQLSLLFLQSRMDDSLAARHDSQLRPIKFKWVIWNGCVRL